MKLKLLETVQGVDISGVHLIEGFSVKVLEPGEVYEVSQKLGEWLLETRKAEKIESAPHYGAQSEPEYPRNDEAKYEEMIADETAAPEVLPAKKTRKNKGAS